MDWLDKLLFTKEQLEIIDAIKSSGIKSHRVVGKGTLVVDCKEVQQTEKFKEYGKKAKEIVEANNVYKP